MKAGDPKTERKLKNAGNIRYKHHCSDPPWSSAGAQGGVDVPVVQGMVLEPLSHLWLCAQSLGEAPKHLP